MRDQLSLLPLQLNITVGSKNFAVQWENEKTGLPATILDYSVSKRDDEDIRPVEKKRKDQYRLKQIDASNDMFLQLIDNFDLSIIVGKKTIKEEEFSIPNETTPVSLPVIDYTSYSPIHGATSVFPVYSVSDTSDDELKHRFHYRDQRQRVPLCRGGRTTRG